jgi:hypothetical protein
MACLYPAIMKLLANTLTKRNAACVMLLIWAFALASGVANACLLDTHGAHSHASSGGSAAPDHVHTGLAAHSEGFADHDEDSDTSRAPCLKLCNEDSKFLPKQRIGSDTTDAGHALFVAVLWLATTPDFAAVPTRVKDLSRRAPELPFRVQYSRMTL